MKTTPPTWDLTCSISPHLDLHMMFPLLEFVDSLIDNGLIPYSSTDVAQARLALLRPTHMVDYAMDIYRELHQGTASAEVPEEMEQQKAAVYEKLEALRVGCSTLDDLCKNAEERVSWIHLDKKNELVFFAFNPQVANTLGIIFIFKQTEKVGR